MLRYLWLYTELIAGMYWNAYIIIKAIKQLRQVNSLCLEPLSTHPCLQDPWSYGGSHKVTVSLPAAMHTYCSVWVSSPVDALGSGTNTLVGILQVPIHPFKASIRYRDGSVIFLWLYVGATASTPYRPGL